MAGILFIQYLHEREPPFEWLTQKVANYGYRPRPLQFSHPKGIPNDCNNGRNTLRSPKTFRSHTHQTPSQSLHPPTHQVLLTSKTDHGPISTIILMLYPLAPGSPRSSRSLPILGHRAHHQWIVFIARAFRRHTTVMTTVAFISFHLTSW